MGSDVNASSLNCLLSSVLIVSIVLCFFVFVRFFVNVVLFDLRGIEGDVASGIITIPAYVGRNKTKNLLLLVNSTLVIWLAYSYMQGLFHRILLFLFSPSFMRTFAFCISARARRKSENL